MAWSQYFEYTLLGFEFHFPMRRFPVDAPSPWFRTICICIVVSETQGIHRYRSSRALCSDSAPPTLRLPSPKTSNMKSVCALILPILRFSLRSPTSNEQTYEWIFWFLLLWWWCSLQSQFRPCNRWRCRVWMSGYFGMYFPYSPSCFLSSVMNQFKTFIIWTC